MSSAASPAVTSLSATVTKLEDFAKAEWAKVETIAENVAAAVDSEAEDGFEKLVTDFGQFAVATVISLFTTEFDNLTGSEKNNLAVTTVVDNAAQAGVTLLAEDATALVKNAFVAVVGTAP